MGGSEEKQESPQDEVPRISSGTPYLDQILAGGWLRGLDWGRRPGIYAVPAAGGEQGGLAAGARAEVQPTVVGAAVGTAFAEGDGDCVIRVGLSFMAYILNYSRKRASLKRAPRRNYAPSPDRDFYAGDIYDQERFYGPRRRKRGLFR